MCDVFTAKRGVCCFGCPNAVSNSAHCFSWSFWCPHGCFQISRHSATKTMRVSNMNSAPEGRKAKPKHIHDICKLLLRTSAYDIHYVQVQMLLQLGEDPVPDLIPISQAEGVLVPAWISEWSGVLPVPLLLPNSLGWRPSDLLSSSFAKGWIARCTRKTFESLLTTMMRVQFALLI